MKYSIAALVFLIAIFSLPSSACSLVTPQPAEFDPSLAKSGEQPPDPPSMKIKGIYRGNADDPSDSCSDLGVVTLSLPATARNKKLFFSFQTLSGKADDIIFQHGPSKGIEVDGELLFVFPWLDGAITSQEPLDLVVRVTPYRASGLAGKSVDLVVHEPGR